MASASGGSLAAAASSQLPATMAALHAASTEAASAGSTCMPRSITTAGNMCRVYCASFTKRGARRAKTLRTNGRQQQESYVLSFRLNTASSNASPSRTKTHKAKNDTHDWLLRSHAGTKAGDASNRRCEDDLTRPPPRAPVARGSSPEYLRLGCFAKPALDVYVEAGHRTQQNRASVPAPAQVREPSPLP